MVLLSKLYFVYWSLNIFGIEQYWWDFICRYSAKATYITEVFFYEMSISQINYCKQHHLDADCQDREKCFAKKIGLWLNYCLTMYGRVLFIVYRANNSRLIAL